MLSANLFNLLQVPEALSRNWFLIAMDQNLKFRNLESDTVDCGDYIFLILATITSGLSSDLLNAGKWYKKSPSFKNFTYSSDKAVKFSSDSTGNLFKWLLSRFLKNKNSFMGKFNSPYSNLSTKEPMLKTELTLYLQVCKIWLHRRERLSADAWYLVVR